MSSILPIKTLPITGITLTPTGFWPYDEGSYYGEDQFWQGGPAPQPVTFTLAGTITQQDHGSFSTPQLYVYNGLDVKVGDWYIEASTGKALMITAVNAIATTTTYLSCTIEDVDRWEQFSDPNGISATGASGFIISLSEEGLPMFHDLIFYNPEIVPNIGFIEDMISRFRSRNLNGNRVRVNQIGHTFQVGDSIVLESSGIFALANAGTVDAQRVIGMVTDIGIPGVNWFNYEPRGKLIRDISPALPGLPGDILWLDPSNPGQVTASKPNSLAIPIWIKINNSTAVKLYQGPIGPLDNYDALVNPTANDDETLGYSIGSRWVNTFLDSAWILVDATAGAAIWREIDAPGPTGPTGAPVTGAYQKYEFIATSGQTMFMANHVPGFTDVYYNGVRLTPSDFDDSNASYVTLLNPSTAGDPVEIIAWEIASISQLTGPTGPSGTAGPIGPTGPAATGAYVRHEFVATSGQTVFNLPYSVGFVDVYYNGTLLSQDQYTATNGTTVVLNNPAVAGDPVVAISWEITNVSQVTGPTGPTGYVEGTTFNTIAERDAYTPILGQIVYVLNDGSGHNAMFVAAQISPSIVWVPISIGPAGVATESPTAGVKKFTSTLTKTVGYSDTSPAILGNIEANSTVLRVSATVTTEFDGGGSYVTVGTVASPTLFMANYMSDTETQGTYINEEQVDLPSNTEARIFIFPGASTQGNVRVVLTYQ